LNQFSDDGGVYRILFHIIEILFEHFKNMKIAKAAANQKSTSHNKTIIKYFHKPTTTQPQIGLHTLSFFLGKESVGSFFRKGIKVY
jgi:hypothetical protein